MLLEEDVTDDDSVDEDDMEELLVLCAIAGIEESAMESPTNRETDFFIKGKLGKGKTRALYQNAKCASLA